MWRFLGQHATEIFALAAAVIGLFNRKDLKKTQEQVIDLQIKVDGRLTQLLNLTKQSSHAEGVIEGKKDNV